MKQILVVLLMFKMGVIVHAQSQFLDLALSDINVNSTYIAIDIISDHYSGGVIIENTDLFFYMQKEYNVTLDDYRLIIKNLITQSKSLSIWSGDLEANGFFIVPKVGSVELYPKESGLRKIHSTSH